MIPFASRVVALVLSMPLLSVKIVGAGRVIISFVYQNAAPVFVKGPVPVAFPHLALDEGKPRISSYNKWH